MIILTKCTNSVCSAISILIGSKNHDRGLSSTPSVLTNTPTITIYLRGESYGDWSLEPHPPPKGVIDARTNIDNLFLQDLHIPKPHNRDLVIPIRNLHVNFKITTPGMKISEHWETLTNAINKTPTISLHNLLHGRDKTIVLMRSRIRYHNK